MRFLKTLFLFLVAVIAALFIQANWTWVQLHLFAVQVEVNLPLLLGIAFLLGWLPMMLWHHAVRWRLRQRLGAAERAIADLRGAANAAAAAIAEESPLPPAAIPSAVPPGVA
ncbi:LapA family protein [Sphingomonas sp.]|uniref:LapA family protein n=1 Tax=Sphingomonas sp. TaxID=28214 RepID=UPI001D5CCC17|nr:LapA family protein [Sphingomonas sp.]MBX9796666.1 LapA family protein [Sphingomonas sp.]